MQVGNTTIATSFVPSVAVYNILVDIIRLTKIPGAMGITEGETVLLSSLPARIRWRSGTERMMADKVTYYGDATLHCRKPAGVTITTNDRVRYDGKDYEIVDIQDFRNLGRLLSMELKRFE